VSPAARRLTSGDKVRLIAPLVIYAILILIAWKLGYFREQNVEAAAKTSTGSPFVGAAFVIIYGTLGALALPVTPLAYGAGAIFGFWRGSILVWIGSMIGAIAGYYLARTIWAKPARALLGHYNEKLHALRKGDVFLTTLRLQLMPVIPFGPLTYAAAISKFEPLGFFAGTALGIIPGTLIATFIGAQLAAGVHGKGKKPYLWGGIVAAVALALTFAPKLWKKPRGQ
jgi:uncharacterized membrane protein YdjX (TVP38/TMEM64 family)